MHQIKKFLNLIAGTIIILIGIAGLALPLLPGWVLIFAGISIIDRKKAKEILIWLKKKLKIGKYRSPRK